VAVLDKVSDLDQLILSEKYKEKIFNVELLKVISIIII